MQPQSKQRGSSKPESKATISNEDCDASFDSPSECPIDPLRVTPVKAGLNSARKGRFTQRLPINSAITQTLPTKRVNLGDLNQTPSHKKFASTEQGQRTPN